MFYFIGEMSFWNFRSFTSFVNKTLAAMPGKTNVKNGNNFKIPAKTVPPFAWEIFLAANNLCVIT